MSELLTIGEALDNIKEGYYAISRLPLDNKSIIAIDDTQWIYFVPSHRKYKKYGLTFKYHKGKSEKRWEIRKIDDHFIKEIEGLEFAE